MTQPWHGEPQEELIPGTSYSAQKNVNPQRKNPPIIIICKLEKPDHFSELYAKVFSSDQFFHIPGQVKTVPKEYSRKKTNTRIYKHILLDQSISHTGAIAATCYSTACYISPSLTPNPPQPRSLIDHGSWGIQGRATIL